jgi:hypothetical protein
VWWQLTALVAAYALALNIGIGSLCHRNQQVVDAWGNPICTQHGNHDRAGQAQGPIDHSDYPGFCCKCCGTAAFNVAAAAPDLPIPIRVEWKQPSVLAAFDLPRPPRHLIEAARGPPLTTS